MFARIDELLRERGISQTQLAHGIGVSTGNVSDWKNGKARPSVTVLVRIADYLNVSVDYLMGRTDIPNAGELTDIYNLGITRWINDSAFSAENTARLKDNFCELLMRYKDVVTALAGSMRSAKTDDAGSPASYDGLAKQTCKAVERQLRNLICWAASFPLDFNRSSAGDDTNVVALTESVYDSLGVLTDDKMASGFRGFTEEERDLLDIWSYLDKPGKRIVIGAAEEQRQRVAAEREKTIHETA